MRLAVAWPAEGSVSTPGNYGYTSFKENMDTERNNMLRQTNKIKNMIKWLKMEQTQAAAWLKGTVGKNSNKI